MSRKIHAEFPGIVRLNKAKAGVMVPLVEAERRKAYIALVKNEELAYQEQKTKGNGVSPNAKG
jgi:hypothetical protein